jgi:hypothetical protein
MKFILFCEGDTEKKALPDFLKRWLDPRLSQPVGIKPVGFSGWPELVKDAPTKASLHVRKKDVIAVISLLDLYGPTFYPDHLTRAEERYLWAKAYIEGKVGLEKFRQYFAVHEVEAWLLSRPDIFPAVVKKDFPHKVNHPETVNFSEPPAKLLMKIFKKATKRNYKKVTHGKEYFDKLDPAVAYQKCPKLKAMLDDMLQLAEEAL